MEPKKTRSTNLENLLKAIHEDGLEKARLEADLLISRAKIEADLLVKNAQEMAQSIEKKSADNIQQTEAALSKRLQMAARDLELSLLEQLTQRFEKFTTQKVTEALTPPALVDLIKQIIPHLNGPVSLEVGSSQAEEAVQRLVGEFADSLGAQVELKTNPKIKAGFWVTEQGQERFFEFSSAEIAKQLLLHTGPKLRELWLKGNSQGGE